MAKRSRSRDSFFRKKSLRRSGFKPAPEGLEVRVLLSASWVTQSVPPADLATPDLAKPDLFRGVWGTGPNDIFVVGRNSDPAVLPYGVIDHYDGTGWTAIKIG